MNKRGQGGMSMEMLVGLIALVLVLLFAVLFFSGAFDKLSGAIDSQGVETKGMILSCQTDLGMAKTDESKLSQYCNNFKTPLIVGGKENYVNCWYLEQRGLYNFSEDEIPSLVKVSCTLDLSRQRAYDKCKEFKQVNNQSSDSWVEYINGIKCTKTTDPKLFGSLVTDYDLYPTTGFLDHN